MKLIRQIIGCVVGVGVAGATIAVVEAIGHGMGPHGRAFSAAIAGYAAGAAIGTFAAAMIAGHRASVAVPVILAVLAIVNLFSFPHPWWFAPTAALALTAGWLFGRSIAGRVRRRPPSGQLDR